jgi:hypothetical protein
MTTKIKSGVIGDNVVGITQLNVSDGTNGQVLTTDGSGTLSFSTVSGYTDSDVETYLNTSEIYTDATNNRLGIGTSSPDADLSLLSPVYTSGGTGNGVRFQNQNNNADAIIQSYYSGTSPSALFSGANAYLSTGATFTSFDSAKASSYVLQNTNGNIEFGNATSGNPTTKMLLDSSGNLLVGTNATGVASSSSVEGIQIAPTTLSVARSGGQVAFFNRQTNDGDIVDFRKDGSTVGSIGNISTRMYIGSGDTGIYFDSIRNQVQPNNPSTGSNIDATIDLGRDVFRFKDLYLSGQISTYSTGGLSITSDSTNRGILNLSTDTAYQLLGGSYYGYTGYKTGGYHRFFGSDGSEDMRIDSSGRVGINRTPSITNSKLEIGGADDVPLINVEASGATGGMGIGSTGLQLFHGSTARMKIDSSGRVIVGSGGSIHFSGNTSTGFITEDGVNLQLRSDGAMTFYTYSGGWQVRMTIADGGLISGDFNDTSDVALKENIVAIEDGMSVISQMRPVSFDWRDVVTEDKEGNEVTVPSGKGSTKGLIAQEVEAIDAELVVGEEGEKAINTSGVLAYAIKAIQEQQTIIDDLKSRIEALEE